VKAVVTIFQGSVKAVWTIPPGVLPTWL